jgi:hypothetical protein
MHIHAFLKPDWLSLGRPSSHFGYIEAKKLPEVMYRPCPFNANHRIRGTHFVYLGQPLPLVDLAGMKFHDVSDRPAPSLAECPELLAEPFAQEERGADCLYLVPIQYPMLNMSEDDQCAEVARLGYEMSTAVEAALAQELFYSKHGHFFGGSMFARTKSRANNQDRIFVGVGDGDSHQLSLVRSYQRGPLQAVGVTIHLKVPIDNIEQ